MEWVGRVDRSIDRLAIQFTLHLYIQNKQGSSLLPLWLLSLLLGRGGGGGGGGGNGGSGPSDWVPRQLVLGGSGGQGGEGGQQPQQQHDPCLEQEGAWTVWEDWRLCHQSQGMEVGDDWLAAAPPHWEGFEAAAVLVELERADARPLRHAIRNAMENLPVLWRVQVVAGSDAVEATVLRLFPVEVEVGKIVVTQAIVEEEEEKLEGKVSCWVCDWGGGGRGWT